MAYGMLKFLIVVQPKVFVQYFYILGTCCYSALLRVVHVYVSDFCCRTFCVSVLSYAKYTKH